MVTDSEAHTMARGIAVSMGTLRARFAASEPTHGHYSWCHTEVKKSTKTTKIKQYYIKIKLTDKRVSGADGVNGAHLQNSGEMVRPAWLHQ